METTADGKQSTKFKGRSRLEVANIAELLEKPRVTASERIQVCFGAWN